MYNTFTWRDVLFISFIINLKIRKFALHYSIKQNAAGFILTIQVNFHSVNFIVFSMLPNLNCLLLHTKLVYSVEGMVHLNMCPGNYYL